MIETKSDAVVAYHGIVPTGATGIEVDRADFQYFIDKVAALNDAGVIEAVSFSEFMADTPSGGGGGAPSSIISNKIITR
jgi:hypothetical protein